MCPPTEPKGASLTICQKIRNFIECTIKDNSNGGKNKPFSCFQSNFTRHRLNLLEQNQMIIIFKVHIFNKKVNSWILIEILQLTVFEVPDEIL